jgi:hypothetical protein
MTETLCYEHTLKALKKDKEYFIVMQLKYYERWEALFPNMFPQEIWNEIWQYANYPDLPEQWVYHIDIKDIQFLQ